MNKRLLSVGLAAMLTFLLAAGAGADAVFEQNIRNLSVSLQQGRPLPGWLFDEVLRTGLKATLQGEGYSLTFVPENLPSGGFQSAYDLSLVRLTEGFMFNELSGWVGGNTPRYVLLFAEGETLPAPALVTLQDTSFAPYSTLYVYRRTEDAKYQTIALDVAVDKEGNVAFAAREGGAYLVSARRIEERVIPYGYEMPQYLGTQELLGAGLSGGTGTSKSNPATGAARRNGRHAKKREGGF
jgi:hypothetical protein